MIPNLFSAHSRETMPDVVNKAKDIKNNFSGDALVRYYEAMIGRPDRTEVLRSSKVPVLFVMGKYDTAVRVEDGLKQCHLPENAYIHILRESGHMGMLEEKELSNLALDKFLWYN
jgi:pimeloyl-ACP methyl ester carboxylesterase